jgi:hypothetical protein
VRLINQSGLAVPLSRQRRPVGKHSVGVRIVDDVIFEYGIGIPLGFRPSAEAPLEVLSIVAWISCPERPGKNCKFVQFSEPLDISQRRKSSVRGKVVPQGPHDASANLPHYLSRKSPSL